VLYGAGVPPASRRKFTLYLAPDVFDDLRAQMAATERQPGWLIEQAWRKHRGMTEPQRAPREYVEPPPMIMPYLGRHKWVGPAHQTLGRQCHYCQQYRVNASAECPGPTERTQA
jgi:hypothetical protein